MNDIKENAMIQYLTFKVCGYLSHNKYVLASFPTLQNNLVHAYIYIYIYISQCNYIYNLQGILFLFFLTCRRTKNKDKIETHLQQGKPEIEMRGREAKIIETENVNALKLHQKALNYRNCFLLTGLICSSNHTTKITNLKQVHWIENSQITSTFSKNQKFNCADTTQSILIRLVVSSTTTYNKNVAHGSMPEKHRIVTLGDKIVNIR